MLYLTIKSFHILAAIMWIGSIGVVSYITSRTHLDSEQLQHARRITEFGIGATWIAGIALVLMGGWYTATWWQIKIVLVIVISAIHSIIHRQWKRTAENQMPIATTFPIFIVVLSCAVVFLAVFKQPV